MKLKQKIVCEYCEAQGIRMAAVLQKSKAIKPDHVRYGCENEHYFSVPIKAVEDRTAV